jgi:hypothetical protein
VSEVHSKSDEWSPPHVRGRQERAAQRGRASAHKGQMAFWARRLEWSPGAQWATRTLDSVRACTALWRRGGKCTRRVSGGWLEVGGRPVSLVPSSATCRSDTRLPKETFKWQEMSRWRDHLKEGLDHGALRKGSMGKVTDWRDPMAQLLIYASK